MTALTQKLLRKRQTKHRLVAAFAFFGVALCLFSSMPVYAVTQTRLKTYLDGGVAPAYDPDFCSGTGGSGAGGQPTIVVDPGHSGKDIQETYADSGLTDHDYPNQYENEEMFYVALQVKKQLKAKNYNVILTKGDDISTDNVSGVDSKGVKEGAKIDASLKERAEVANSMDADLAVSLHDDHSAPWKSFAQVYTQKAGTIYDKDGKETGKKPPLYREGKKGKVEFKDEAVAKKSQVAGHKIVSARAAAEGHKVDNTDVNFAGRGLDPGNIPMVMLFSKVPWVYNEVGGGSGFLDKELLDRYVKGMVNGITAAVPAGAASASTQLTGDNTKDAFDILITKGLEPYQSAGVVGNLLWESGGRLDPKIVEGGSRSDTIVAGKGYGIAQWTSPDRQQGLKDLAKKERKGVGDLGVQLDFLWQELNTGYKGALKSLKASKDVEAATKAFMDDFEKPGKPHLDKRIDLAIRTLKNNGAGAPATGDGDIPSAASGCDGGGGESGSVECNGDGETSGSVSEARQKIVCIAEREFGLWNNKPVLMKPLANTDSSDRNTRSFFKYQLGRTSPKPSISEPWCADFASWVYKQAGVPLKASNNGNVAAVAEMIKIGKAGKDFDYRQKPKVGDLAIFDNGAHVNIVVKVEGNKVSIIGGNEGSRGRGSNYSKVMEGSFTAGGTYGGQRNTGFVGPKD